MDFTRRATAAGNTARLILFPYSGHDFNTTYGSITNQAMLQIIAQFSDQPRIGVERRIEAARVEHLRHQADVGQIGRVAAEESARRPPSPPARRSPRRSSGAYQSSRRAWSTPIALQPLAARADC